ncbi:MAG: hypothetical protein COX70_06105 [Flavobacteriales bacterium CG_4_10_14_0_2_um_filter_32_8]|nr:MAG: hypothetical protein COX70_06105 [Flavobacteriales bacterium CG_4_10_14_0_2_um_filter_32_8]PJB16122.1 MAG: hypothetical protein CO118_01085 [Flavobacteriales bacterium CG_4_9_14_3_um_filter_32_8]
MKKLLLFLGLLLIAISSFTQKIYIPDINFRLWLQNNYTSCMDGDSIITNCSTVINATSVNVSFYSIIDLTGIEAFTSIDTLYCENNQLTNLDVFANTALTTLNCNNNQLTNLDVSANTGLTTLDCRVNALTSLDVSTNTDLTTLKCSENPLTSLDVSSNTALTTLMCNNSPYTSSLLSSLNLSGATALTYLNCSFNSLSNLDVSANTALTTLHCDYNQLTNLDVSANTSLTDLVCYYNQLTNLDVSANTALTTLDCDYNQITNLDVSANMALTTLRCFNNQLTSLNVKNGNNTNFIYFNATNNPNLTCIQVDNAIWSSVNWIHIDIGAYFNENCPLGIVAVKEQLNILMYPNPSKGILNIEFDRLNNNATLSIIDISGKEIINDKIMSGSGLKQIDMQNLAKGVYVVKVVTEKTVKVEQLLLQ